MVSHHVPSAEAQPKQKKETPVDHRLFRGGRVLGDGLGALRHGVLGQLTGQDEANTARERMSVEGHPKCVTMVDR